MARMLTIHAKRLGQRKPAFVQWRIAVPPEWEAAGGRVTLRELITQVVRDEVESFQARQEEMRLLGTLSAAEISAAAGRGKVAMGGSDLQQPVDAGAAVATALQAFEDGLYHVFVDDRQQETLDTEIVLRPESQVLFLRLTALVGG